MIEDSRRKRMYIYVCMHEWVTILHSRNLHNTVNQLHANKIKLN